MERDRRCRGALDLVMVLLAASSGCARHHPTLAALLLAAATVINLKRVLKADRATAGGTPAIRPPTPPLPSPPCSPASSTRSTVTRRPIERAPRGASVADRAARTSAGCAWPGCVRRGRGAAAESDGDSGY
jgi:hypothetical protein